MINGSYRQCKRCVMDTTALDIIFDDEGICNYCKDYLERYSFFINEKKPDKQNRMKILVEKVKKSGKNKPYDCVVGISGGVDSSWTLVEVKKLGLRPLAVHMDNGWNSELAQNNIANLVRELGVDLYTHVIDWEEYRDLMQAFFDGDVIDVELLYDNATLAVNYGQAKKYNIKYILAGTNIATEGMSIPRRWNWFKFDKQNIKALARRNKIINFKTFPSIGTFGFVWNHFIRRIRWISFLDYLDYNKFHSLNALEKKYGYKRYPYKHYESIFTRFYQGYLLPNKFGVDKRKIHLGNLIMSKQMKREEALKILQDIPYPSLPEMNSDKNYFLKKMKWSEEQLNNYIKRSEILHSDYSSEKYIWDKLNTFYKYFFKSKKNNKL